MFVYQRRIKPILGISGFLGFLGFLGLISGFESFFVFFSFFSFFGFYWIGKMNSEEREPKQVFTVKVRGIVFVLFTLSLIVYFLFEISLKFHSYLLITCALLFSLLCVLSTKAGYEERQ